MRIYEKEYNKDSFAFPEFAVAVMTPDISCIVTSLPLMTD